ncbi:MAG: hypothetical protein II427_04590, partial [Firmicutes bacterium]|nr:hypothetical protein [Bacillota bacterium]
ETETLFQQGVEQRADKQSEAAAESFSQALLAIEHCDTQLHDAGSFAAIGPWIEGAKRYFLQVFMDRDTVPYAGLSAPSDAQMRAYADLVRPYAADVQIRGLN